MGCVSGKQKSVDISPSRAGQQGSRPVGTAMSRDDYNRRHSGRYNPSTAPAEPAAPPNAEDAKSDEEKEVLRVEEVDFQVAENAAAHRTDKYELTDPFHDDDSCSIVRPQLVVRRGQPFDLTIKFDREYDVAKDDLRIIFDVGKKPLESKGTRVIMMLSDTDYPREWGAKILSNKGQQLDIRVFTPPNCIVAKWNFKFDTVVKKEDSKKTFRYTHSDPVYIIFNPWCPDDQVYMDDETARKEYVLNDHGRIFRGTKKQIHPKPWNFGQFEDFMLDCCMHLLDNSGLNTRVRGDPVLVARKISAITNAPDDNGVIVGNWSGNYAGGTSPLAWVGSVKIMEQYWKTMQPVNFGQCWVFSGVVTTICRCLGIPCRSVTNFASAHDSDGTITIDNHWTVDGKPLEEYNQDSVWNFHVWNDVWMARPDLPSGFGGWQAIDSTPQETSDGVYCAGPASVEAIKNGLVHLPYDGPFIFAEVNADRVHWIQKPEGGWANTKQMNSIGKFISTKKSTSSERDDITRMYKYPEGTQQERTAVWRAAKEGSSRTDIYEVQKEDVFFDLIEKESVQIGEPFEVVVKVKNTSTEERNVKLTLTATVVYYTGVPVHSIKTQTFEVKAEAGQGGEIKMNVTPEEYLDKLVDLANLKIHCMANVKETKQFHCESDDFRLSKPDLDIKVPEEVISGQEYEVEVSFKNPLPRTLTKCEFSIEGPSFLRPLALKCASVGPHAEAKVTGKVKAKRPGEKMIVASFDAKELADLSGETSIKVKPKPAQAPAADPAPES